MKQVIVRAYGTKLLGGRDAEAHATAIFLAQNRLWNNFVEIEQANRLGYLAVLASSDKELSELRIQETADESSIEFLRDLRSKARSQARTKKIKNSDVYSDSIGMHAKNLKAIREKIKACKARAKIIAVPLVQALELERRTKVKQAIDESGLWWAHSQTVIAKYEVARIRAMKEGAQLRLHRFDGEGSMGIRFSIDGGSLDKIRAGTTDLLGISRPDASVLGPAKELKADGGRRVLFTVRAGKKDDEGKIPKLTFLTTIHGGRELPEGIPLKTVTLRRDMHIGRCEWKIVFTFSKEIETLPPVDLPKEACGIDFGWRSVYDRDGDKELRVAAISWGAEKPVQYVSLTSEWLKRMERADQLQGRLNDTANVFATRVLPLITEEALLGESISEDEWFFKLAGKARRAKRAYPALLMELCKAHAALATPITKLSEIMMPWMHATMRLANETHHTRRKAINHRKHLYRNIAALIVKRAGLLGVEGANLQEMARLTDKKGKETELQRAARHQRVLASPSELRSAIIQASKRDQRELKIIPPAGTTSKCSSCGHDHGSISDLMFVCEGCGKLWDQDENASHNCRNIALECENIS